MLPLRCCVLRIIHMRPKEQICRSGKAFAGHLLDIYKFLRYTKQKGGIENADRQKAAAQAVSSGGGVSRFCVDSAGYGAGEQRGEVAVESDIAVCGGGGGGLLLLSSNIHIFPSILYQLLLHMDHLHNNLFFLNLSFHMT